MMKPLCILMFFLFSLSHLAAELAWETTEITPMATLEDKAIEQDLKLGTGK